MADCVSVLYDPEDDLTDLFECISDLFKNDKSNDAIKAFIFHFKRHMQVKEGNVTVAIEKDLNITLNETTKNDVKYLVTKFATNDEGTYTLDHLMKDLLKYFTRLQMDKIRREIEGRAKPLKKYVQKLISAFIRQHEDGLISISGVICFSSEAERKALEGTG